MEDHSGGFVAEADEAGAEADPVAKREAGKDHRNVAEDSDGDEEVSLGHERARQ